MSISKSTYPSKFEHLPNAPIGEAVIHWRARSEKKPDPASLLERLKGELPDYPDPQRQNELRIGAEVSADSSSVRQHQAWRGFRFESADKLHVAQFTRDGFVFSRLKPYMDWEQFEREAQRLWQIYCRLAEPSEIQRLGVRFINLVVMVDPGEVASLLRISPEGPAEMQLPLQEFMHQNIFDIPGHPYNLKVIQTVQPPNPPERDTFHLILDIDVFTTQPTAIDSQRPEERLQEMRWIKNKAFFASLTEEAISRFKE